VDIRSSYLWRTLLSVASRTPDSEFLPPAPEDRAIRPVQPAMPHTQASNAGHHPVRRSGHAAVAEPAPDRPAHGTGRRRRTSLIVALAGIVLLALNLRGAVTAVPPLVDRVRDDLAMSTTLVGVLGSLPTLAFAAAGWAGARLLRRYAAETIAVGVLVLTGLGQAARPWSGSALGFLVLSASTLFAMGIGNVILPPLVKAWFPNRIGGVTAAYVAMIATGTAIPAALAVPVADAVDAAGGEGWRVALTAWAALALVGLPTWIVLARIPRALPATVSAAQPRVHLPLHRSRIARGLALLFAMTGLNTYAMLTWLPERLTDAGLSAAAAGGQLALFAGIGAVPSLVMPLLAVRVRRVDLLVAACVGCFVAGYTGLLLAPGTATAVWVLLTGLGPSTFPLCLTLVGLRSATPATAGALSGFAQGFGYAAAAAGPVVVGILHDTTDGWTAPFGFLGVTLALMLLGGIWVAPPGTVDEELGRGTGVPDDIDRPDTLVE
jgi:CP family cyanate transporter-like MFS transporter